MRTSILALILVGAGIAGAVVYLNYHKTSPAPPAPMAQSPSSSPELTPAAEQTTTLKERAASNGPAMAVAPTNAPAPVLDQAAASNDNSTPVSKAVDALLAAKSAAEKHELFQQLVKSGQIAQAIEELKQRAAANPTDPEIPTTLGEAQLNELKALKDSGGDPNDIGILAMQADQSFNAALKIDPQNWEAQFVKSASMYYWPADPQRDNDVVQRLSGLIDQQQTMPSQPDFAQTYLVLGNEYEKIGQPDKATATWQLGLQQFPNNPQLLAKINGQ